MDPTTANSAPNPGASLSPPAHAAALSEQDAVEIRRLFDDYLRMYRTRDDLLTEWFSENFTGFTGGGDFLVKDRAEWVAITRQDFAQVKEHIRIELKDLALQSLTPTIAVTTGFFTIHLPIPDHILSRETARLVLIFRKEPEGWKIVHSGISIPYQLVQKGEVYPLRELTDRNRVLEELVAQRTAELSAANERLSQANRELVREISERKVAVENAQRSEELYKSILTASPDDITIADEKGRILMVSPVCWEMFRCTGDEQFVGRSVLDFIAPEDRARAMENMGRRLRGGLSSIVEYRGLRLDGTTFDVEVNSEYIRDKNGSPVGMVVIGRDITERKRAEAEKQRLEVQNRQLQKNESLTRMAGAIAHHFNNELHAVMLSLEFALNELPETSAARENVTLALQSAGKAAEVSSLMLSYLGQARNRSARMDLSELCQRSLVLLQGEMPEGTQFLSSFDQPGPVIFADANQLQLVLSKLVMNAAEALPGPTRTVYLSCRIVPTSEIPAAHRFPVDWQAADPFYACLEVLDSGCGIPAESMEKIFDPFYSSKFTGRGMGLAVVLGVARSLDGLVTVESEVGRGSRFRLFLPLCRDVRSHAT
jgi:PAS domain S-box-containing protein